MPRGEKTIRIWGLNEWFIHFMDLYSKNSDEFPHTFRPKIP